MVIQFARGSSTGETFPSPSSPRSMVASIKSIKIERSFFWSMFPMDLAAIAIWNQLGGVRGKRTHSIIDVCFSVIRRDCGVRILYASACETKGSNLEEFYSPTSYAVFV